MESMHQQVLQEIAEVGGAISEKQEQLQAFLETKTALDEKLLVALIDNSIANATTQQGIQELVAIVERLVVAVEQNTQMVLGAEALQNKQLDMINRLLDERPQSQSTVENGHVENRNVTVFTPAPQADRDTINRNLYGLNLRSAITKSGLTIGEYAEHVGVSKSTIEKRLKRKGGQ